jgi:parallel beta-helix repeat protein
VTDSEIAHISQASGCQEGNAIEARSGADATSLRVIGNRIVGYQKTGIGLFGSVSAQIMFNHVEGYGATDRIAQNGIQVSFGARATIRWNTIVNNLFMPRTAASTGIFLWEAGPGCSIGLNALRNNDVGIYVLDTAGARISFNTVQDSTFTSIYQDGAGGNTIQRNRCTVAGNSVECEP